MKDGNYSFSDAGNPLSLDTLAQLGTDAGKQGRMSALAKRARSKFYGRALATQLTVLRSPLEKSYRNSIYCASVLEQNGEKFTGRYCNARWCPVCNRIRTAKMIRGYAPQLALLEDAQFVTLTVPNVPAPDLKGTIEGMIKTAQRVQDAIKKRHQRKRQSWQLVGLRKLECTYNPVANTYHPHFHYLIQGADAARVLVADWLSALPAASFKAQDRRRAHEGASMELFKYFSKFVTEGADGRRVTDTKALDVIFQAMQGKRVFQPIGIRKVPEDIQELQAVESDLPAGFGYWVWFDNDWANVETGEVLTGYIPSQAIQDLVNNIL